MLISLTVLPFVLLLIQSVFGVGLHRNKRALQELRQVRASYSFNHPPSVESYIPVTVIYDDEEDIPVFNKSDEVKDKIDATENTSAYIDSNDDSVTSVTQNLSQGRALYANHPPTVEDYDPIAAAKEIDSKNESDLRSIAKSGDEEILPTESGETTDYKHSDIIKSVTKPKGRSLNLQNTSTTTKTANGEFTQRRRLQRVNKVKVNKVQTTIDATENTSEKTTPKEVISSRINETRENNDQYSRSRKIQRRPLPRDPVVPIIESENYVFAYNGDYHYSYEGGDGTKAFEKGELKTADDGASGTGVVGGFSYKDKDGKDFSLSYTADENGYRPVGAHLPTPPPIPIAIQRALALLATKTTSEPVTERVNKSD